jgi:hypothetical protein
MTTGTRCDAHDFRDSLAQQGRFDVAACSEPSGFEARPAAGGPLARRCRLRIVRPAGGKFAGRWAAFFYKTSAVPHSTDRYSYGAALFDLPLDRARLDTWLDFLDSGFDPDRQPVDVRRALNFELPEFPAVAHWPGAAGGAGDETDADPAPSGGFSAPDGAARTPPRRLNPGELEVELFCRGLRIDPSCRLDDDARVFARTRAGLGSGLELVLPGPLKDLWLNAPVEEDFAQRSPYRLVRRRSGEYRILDDRQPDLVSEDHHPRPGYAVRLPAEPGWYGRTTTRGTRMSRVGVMQGTYLGIYISNSCGFWYHQPEAGCKFCTTGLNVGVNEVAEKDVRDVVETARAAREESGNTFVHFNSGYNGGDRNLDIVAPYVKAVKEEVGALIGVQVVPTKNLWKYDWLVDLGANHFSFCYEFHNPEYFARYLPGKERLIGQDTFFRAMEYTVKRLGKGSCSGEIIAGVEPIEDTLKAIDYITGVGAFPTVCIFRPTIGSAMEKLPSPDPDEMMEVMRYMYEACRRNDIPIGLAPNIEVSLIVNPDDARYLATPDWRTRLYQARLGMMKPFARMHFAREMRPRRVAASATDPGRFRPAPAVAAT